MSLLIIDLAYLAVKGTAAASYQIVKGGYNIYAYAAGSQYWEDSPSEKDSLIQEISSLRNEIGELKSQIKHINEDTFYLVDPSQIDDGLDKQSDKDSEKTP